MGIYYTDDPVRDAECYYRDREQTLMRLPECENCGEHIVQDRAVRIFDMWICDECLDDARETIEIEEY